jgi:hypothetical protein
LLIQLKKIDQLGSPRGFAGFTQAFLPRQAVDRGLFAGIGTPGESDFQPFIRIKLG